MTPTHYAVRYQRSGNAFYAVPRDTWDQAQGVDEIAMTHLLSGVEFEGKKNCLMLPDTEDIPDSYVYDTIALNPLLAMQIGGKFWRLGKHSKFALMQELKDFIARANEKEEGSLKELEEIVSRHE